mgnify:CR=1 FL=1
MEDPDECPICFETMNKTTRVSLGCCSHKMHFDCYVKTLPNCPFCRAVQNQKVIPVIIFKTDWPRITKSICLSVVVSACVSISVLIKSC